MYGESGRGEYGTFTLTPLIFSHPTEGERTGTLFHNWEEWMDSAFYGTFVFHRLDGTVLVLMEPDLATRYVEDHIPPEQHHNPYIPTPYFVINRPLRRVLPKRLKHPKLPRNSPFQSFPPLERAIIGQERADYRVEKKALALLEDLSVFIGRTIEDFLVQPRNRAIMQVAGSGSEGHFEHLVESYTWQARDVFLETCKQQVGQQKVVRLPLAS